MPVTEFRVLPIRNPELDVADSGSMTETVMPLWAISKYQAIVSSLEEDSGHPFRMFRQLESQGVFYMIGTWDSLLVHDMFLDSEEGEVLMLSLQGNFVLHDTADRTELEELLLGPQQAMEMWHIDMCMEEELNNAEGDWKLALDAPIVAVGRYFVDTSMKDAFEQKLKEVKALSQELSKPYLMAYGWRIEKEDDDKEELILFSGLGSLEYQLEVGSKGVELFEEMLAMADGMEVRHMDAEPFSW